MINMLGEFQSEIFWVGISLMLEKSVSFATGMLSSCYKSRSKVYKSRSKVASENDVTNFICHEVRAPLNVITVSSELLKGLLEKAKFDNPSDYSEFKEHLEIIGIAAEQQKETIDLSLDFSKLKAGKYELNNTVFNLQEVLRTIQRTFHHTLVRKNLFLKVDLGATKDIWVESDKILLIRVLSNLISNAIKFTPEGAGLITIKLSYPEIKNIGENLPITVTIKDNGIGMDHLEKNRLFNPFSQANASIHGKFGGSGLGLYYCKLITHTLGGDIELIESEKNSGSTFQFTIRCKTSHPEMQKNQEGIITLSRLPVPRHKKILVVDDNASSRQATTFQLKQLNYEFQTAESGVEALKLCEDTAFDIIFMDILMPSMDGIEATKKIRALEKNLQRSEGACIIGLSGSPMQDKSPREYIGDDGLTAYIEKPCSNERLRNVIDASDISPVAVLKASLKKSTPLPSPVEFFQPAAKISKELSSKRTSKEQGRMPPLVKNTAPFC